jgi:putative ABC transport system permease protein
MPMDSSVSSFLRNLFRRERVERELDDELRSYVELLTAEKVKGGMAPEAARRAAMLEVGGGERLKENVRDIRAGELMSSIIRDLRYALRSLRKTPLFTFAAIFTLALGIGASTAVFSVVNAILLRRLAYAKPEQLTVLMQKEENAISPANYLDWRAQNRAFSEMGAAEYWTPNLTDTDQPEKVWALHMTPSMFTVLAVAPMYGRVLALDSDTPGRDHEVVVSYGFWKRRLGAAREAVGKTITLDGEKYTVVGVMPESFRFAPFWAIHSEIWAPMVLTKRASDRQMQSLRVFARIKDGMPPEQAQAEMTALTARMEQQYPGTNRDLHVRNLTEVVVGNVRRTLQVLLGAVGFVLLIACANVAHMLLARATSRYREMAVRSALGAGRARLLRQLLTESTVLALAGGAAGIGVAAVGLKLLIAQAPDRLPHVADITLDGRVLLFALALSLGTSVIFGLVPAMQSGMRDLNDALRDGSRGSSAGIHRTQLRSFLVASEFALALMLLVGAGLMIRSFRALQQIDAGWDQRGVATVVVSVLGSKEEAPELRTAFYESVVREMEAIPGVRAVSAINHLPLAGDMWGMPYRPEGRPIPKPGEGVSTTYRVVLPGYFKTMRLPLMQGRDFDDNDRLGVPNVVIVNEDLARAAWPGEDPLGKRITMPTGTPEPEWFTVVGVARNAVQLEWTGKPAAEIYLPYRQNRMLMESKSSWVAYLTFVARTDGDASALAGAMRKAVAKVDANVPVSEVSTMDEVVKSATAGTRFNLLLLGSFAGVALALAAVGIYSVISYGVSRRTHEIGIRMALGASRVELLSMVVRQGMVVALAGAGAGLLGALALTGWIGSLLYGVAATDPLTFGVVSGLLILVAVLASYLPARRASKIDPLTALRSE